MTSPTEHAHAAALAALAKRGRPPEAVIQTVNRALRERPLVTEDGGDSDAVRLVAVAAEK